MKAQAQRIIDNEIVEGYYWSLLTDIHSITVKDNSAFIIYPETLKYQICDKWFSMEELEAKIDKQ